MWTTAQIRQQFLNYFLKHQHTVVASSPLVPHNDPTLMFTAAGMVPFKNVFTGLEKRPYTRAASSQKCVRAGGKHNDLENVGYTSRHHTFFEMLGNFSFGDYFKAEAIELAWNLITREFDLPSERLLVTVYAEDEEAAKLWRQIAGLRDEKIIRIASDDNFWSMGETGPCGPCSEIFYDHGDHIAGGPPGSPEQDGDRFVEIWNLVFMQYEQREEGRMDLPRPSIDTGMGLERIAAVLQGVSDNYDIDLFKTLIQSSVELTRVKAEGLARNSHRVIADHLRASAFLIADGVSPSNEGRGYVLRRILRRAVRHAYILGTPEPLMYRLLPTLINVMGDAYPDLKRAQSLITETLRLEEERFRQTLVRGLRLLSEESQNLVTHQALPGEVAFRLYDTFGFPLDLTQDILRAEQKSVDLAGFEKAMARQKAEARAAWAGSVEKQDEEIWYKIHDQHGSSEFLGYTTTEAEAVLQEILVNGQSQVQVEEGQEADFIFNQTPFYGESGGQMGDRGLIIGENGTEIEIRTTHKKINNLHIHKGQVVKGIVRLKEPFKLKIDQEYRARLRANHSATHLLHAVLRKNLGDQVVQKGSLVAADRLRFDFSYNTPLSSEILKELENQVNTLIRRNTEVTTHLMSPEAAIEAGAMALFGEKYGEEVRVVSMGAEVDKMLPYSIELCGGTHVERTGDIGYFKILHESGVAAGIRRLEAVTGPQAEEYAWSQDQILQSAARLLKTRVEGLIERLEKGEQERRLLERQIKDLKTKTTSTADLSSSTAKEIKGFTVLSRIVEDLAPADLKSLVDTLKRQVSSGIVVVGTAFEGKASLVVAVTADLCDRISAVDCIRQAVPILGGKGGGGRADLAQGGGPEGNKLSEAFQRIEDWLKGQ